MKKLFIITGEHSGDKHAADVVRELRVLNPELIVHGIGGENLSAQGVELFSDHSKMNSVGFSLKIILDHISLGRRVVDYLKEFQPDVILMVDYGGFNLNISKVIKKELPHIKICYYIPPQIWASRKWRINTVKKNIDKVFCIFPFEKQLYDENGIDYEFVGHPLVHQIPRGHDKHAFFLKHGLDVNKNLVSIFPGSRVFEVKNLLKTFIKASALIKERLPETQFVIALAPNLKKSVIEQFLPKDCDMQIVQNENYSLLELSDSLILASGTVALEAALYKTPMLISYKGPWFLYMIYLLVRCIKHVSLPNIIMQRDIIMELIQKKSNAGMVAAETLKILTDIEYKNKMVQELSSVENQLTTLVPAKVVAESLINLK